MKTMLMVIAFVCFALALSFPVVAASIYVELPGEGGTKPPVAPFPFPDALSAYVWRNWGLVPTERLAAVVGATVADMNEIAGEMGLAPNPHVLSEWRRRGYITIARRNWHLLPYDQLIRLLDMTRGEFAFCLKEDDSLFAKMGLLKPACSRLEWSRGAAMAGSEGRRRIASVLAEEGIDPNAGEEPRFAFVKEYAAAESGESTVHEAVRRKSAFDFRMIASYFADYGDPLADDEISSFPDGLLQKLEKEGVNAVWMHVVLNTLVKDPKYPEFGIGSERRIANLRKLVARADRYGIKVYLYLNEPRCVTEPFFAEDGRSGMRGVSNKAKNTVALCTSSPETIRWLRDSVKSLFSQVRGLGGALTITMSENLTNCASNGRKEECPRCRGRSVADIVLEVNRTIAEGIAEGDPSAELIVWNWGWPAGIEQEVFRGLPKNNCRVMHVSENGMPVTVGGTTVELNDYSIAIVGPGERAKAYWAEAEKCGLPVVAKVQACCSWELASFPYLPVMDLVAEHARNLEREGVRSVMLSWSCGSAPAPNLRVYGGETLDDIACDLYGAKAAPVARRAWTAFSKGFRRYPFDLVAAYKGPQHWGPANPLYPRATGYEATMVGMPYDALDFGRWDNKWNGRFPADAWLKRFEEVANGFAEGCRLFAEVPPLVNDPAKRKAAERELAMFRAEEMHFRSVVDQSRFILARNAGDKKSMRKFALKEVETAKAYLPLARADSRIGYECSNHYFFVPRDVVEKIVGCRLLVAELPDATPLRLQDDIDAAAARGGGVVRVEPGEHETAPFVLRSNVTLELAEGAVLLASTNRADYPMSPGSKYFIFAEGATNVTIRGKGCIDGRGGAFREQEGLAGESQPQQLPVLMRFSRCRDLRLEDFTYRNGAAWGCHLRNCDGVVMRRVKCFNHVNNTNDGIDIESANVLIEDCDIDADDDAIALKTESDKSFSVTNVVIRNCRLASCCNAFKCGTGSYADVKDVLVENCKFARAAANYRFSWWKTIPGVTNRICGIAGIALEVVDGGRMDGVTVRGITMEGYQTPLFVRLHRRHDPQGGMETYLRNVLVENVCGVADSRIASSITGVPGLRPRDITLRNVSLVVPGGGTPEDAERSVPELETAYPESFMFDMQPLPAYGFYVRHADDVRFEDVGVNIREEDARPAIVRDDVG